MPNTSQEKNALRSKKISGWDDAIEDMQQRIRDLEFSLKVFKDRKRKGEPWPGDVAGTKRESVPA